MFREFFRFEFGFQLRQPLLWLIGLIFGLLAFGATSSDAITIGSSVGNVWRNAPSTVINFSATFSLLGMFVIAIFIAGGMLRDFELGTADLFFASPIKARDYLLGRFAAGTAACLAIFVCVWIGMILGQFMPWIDPKRLGDFSLLPYAWSLAVIVLPNLLFAGAMLALLAALTRSLLMVYLGILAFFVLWIITGSMTRDLDNVGIAALTDPFAIRALAQTMRYWTAEELNNQLPAFSGYLLANRAVWAAISVVMVGLMLRLFSTNKAGTGKARKGRVAEPATSIASAASRVATRAPRVRPNFNATTSWAMFRRQLRFDLKGVLLGVPFVVMLVFSVINFTGSASFIDSLFDTRVYPVTYLMLQALAGSTGLFLFLIVIFYAGELVFKERQAKLNEVVDAMPVPNWVPLAAKSTALIGVIVLFGLVGVLSGIGFQLARGYGEVELGVYAASLPIGLMPFVLIGLLTMSLMVYAQNKFIGFLLIIVVFISQTVLAAMGYEHNLYTFAGAPIAGYSAMNGFGHYLKGWAWFNLYWALFATLLVLLAAALWSRGQVGSWADRRRLAMHKLRGPLGITAAVVAVVWVGCGAWIFYNTNVVNNYVSSDAGLDLQARYERDYSQYKGLPQPKILGARANVDIRPEELSARIEGEYRIINPHATAIDQLHIQIQPLIELESLDLAGAQLISDDEALGYRIYELEPAMQPGAEMKLRFTLFGAERGFGNGVIQTQIVENGSFFNSSLLPQFGYSTGGQIIDRNERRKRDLGEVPRMAKLEDTAAYARNYLTDDGDWIDFSTTVCTAPDQIALAPGYLQREFERAGRRCFEYAMDQPMLPFWAYLSARWEVKKGEWNGIPIEIYYDPAHPYNVDNMIAGTQDSLEYFSAHFSPYQHKQVRILEFPRYARFAQSFANTIPFSESIGFIADLRDGEAVDYVYYVTAHEVAHQWWGHQVIGADVQGGTMLSESLSQYSALMVMEKKYGREKIGKFLKYELDSYLSARGAELVEELPLYRVENQPYIHYRKGSLVFYRLRDEIGEAALNRALSRFIQQYAFKAAPYPTSLDLLKLIREEARPQHQDLITDLFEKITFYDNRVVSAEASAREDGKYTLNLELSASKLYADGVGKESPAELDDWIEVGVYAKPEGEEDQGKVLYLQRHRITDQTVNLELVVDELPYEAGFDPSYKLIDRVSDDNRKRVAMQ